MDRLNITKAEFADNRRNVQLDGVAVETERRCFALRFDERKVKLLNEIRNRERTLGSAALSFLGELDIGERPYVTRRPIFIVDRGKPLADEAALDLAIAVYFRSAEADIPCTG